MITAMSLTNGTLTVIVDKGSQILTARNDHPKWTEIQEAYRAENHDRLLSLLSLQAVVEEYSVGQLSLTKAGVTYGGHPMHTVDSDRVLAFLRDGLPYRPIANYIARKMANPSARAIQEMYAFLEHKNMTLTPDGHFIAYKGVGNDFYSIRGNKETVVIQGTVNTQGQILNEIGAVIEVARSSVDDDFRQGCSFGLHAGSLSYAKGWGQRVVLVEIDPADVVSVPEDCNCQKLRCCKYKVIGEYTGPMPDTYTTEFSDTEANAEWENDADECPKCHSRGECDCNIESTYTADHSDRDAFEDTGESDPELPTVVIEDNVVAPKLTSIFGDIFNLTPGAVIDLKATIKSLNGDELDEIKMIAEIEDVFGLNLGFEDAEMLEKATFGKMIEFLRGKTVIVPAVTKTVIPEQTAYQDGILNGIRDLANGELAHYLAGDQEAADSSIHASYIDGYLVGYANGGLG